MRELVKIHKISTNLSLSLRGLFERVGYEDSRICGQQSRRFTQSLDSVDNLSHEVLALQGRISGNIQKNENIVVPSSTLLGGITTELLRQLKRVSAERGS